MSAFHYLPILLVKLTSSLDLVHVDVLLWVGDEINRH